MDRKAELEKKRKKLEELRKAREAKQSGVPVGDVAAALPKAIDDREREREDVNSLLSSLLGDRATLTPSVSPLPPRTPEDGGSQEASAGLLTAPEERSINRPKPVLTTTPISRVSVTPPAPLVSYEKGTQSEAEWLDDLVKKEIERQSQSAETETEEYVEEHLSKTASNMKASESNALVEVETILSDEQAASIMKTDDFQAFFERSTRMIERALNEPYDFAVDYSAGDESVGQVTGGRELSLIWNCNSDKLTRGRGVTCIDWSSKFPELFATSYTQNDSLQSESHGRVLVWNTHLQDRPEFTFSCQSAVMSVCFAKFHSHLIFGGTYSGQLVLWDTRAKSAPVQRTPLSSQSHTYPVYCLDIVGTQNANNLISASTDGRVCSWATDMLSEPHDSLDLQNGPRKVAVMSMAFAENDANTFVAGSDDSNLYIGSRHGNNRGIVETLVGHNGPVTAVHHHPSHGDVDFSDNILSSSTDWTIKLWSKSGNRVVYSFEEAGDYVYDVQWSPTHPAVFASVDGQSRLCVWNLNEDTEIPVVTAKVSERGAALNRVRWSADGRRILVGDLEGLTYVYEVGELFVSPRLDDWSQFRDVMRDMSIFSNAEDIAR